MHPLAFIKESGALGMKAGDRFVHADGRRGVLDEFLPDGDAFVTWDDGSFGIIKWREAGRSFITPST